MNTTYSISDTFSLSNSRGVGISANAVRAKSKSHARSFVMKMMLVVGMMVVFGGAMKGAEQTITLDYSSLGLTTSYTLQTATVDGYGFTVNKGYKGTGNVIQMNSSQGLGILYNTTPILGLKSITINVDHGSNSYEIYQGTSEQPTTEVGSGFSTKTINIT